MLSFVLTSSDDSTSLPQDVDSINPQRSLADAAYAGNACLETAHEHDATLIHDLHKDHAYTRLPKIAYEKLCNFATH